MNNKYFTFMEAIEYAKTNFPCQEAMFVRNGGERILFLGNGIVVILEDGRKSLTFEDIDYEKWEVKMIWEK